MKNFFLATVVFLFASNYSLANTDTAECDKITEKLKIGEKIDCLLAVKMKKMNLGTKTKENCTDPECQDSCCEDSIRRV